MKGISGYLYAFSIVFPGRMLDSIEHLSDITLPTSVILTDSDCTFFIVLLFMFFVGQVITANHYCLVSLK